MNREDALALVNVGEIDEEDFVETSFAQQFGWESGDVVGGGDDEDGRAFFLQPRDEGTEGACGVDVGVVTGDAGESLFDFIDPEDAGGE